MKVTQSIKDAPSTGSPQVVERAPIKPFVHHDNATGQTISLKESPFYTTLSIDGRDYYFIRETGEFDGTGMTVAVPGSPGIALGTPAGS